MNAKQLISIKNFAKPFYNKTGKYHGWEHVLRVEKHALDIAKAYKETDLIILQAACYLHDIGRVDGDRDHHEAGINKAIPFLRKINLSDSDIKSLVHAISSHDVNQIKKARTIEAKILFDADKLEIASVNGFIRMIAWLTEERGMKVNNAVDFLWDNIKKALVNDLIRTKEAKKILGGELKVIKQLVAKYKLWEDRFKEN